MSYAQIDNDHAILDLLEAVDDPGNKEKIALCCMFSRYDDDEVGLRAVDLAYKWGHSPVTLQAQCREIYLAGLDHTETTTNTGGSSYDTSADLVD